MKLSSLLAFLPMALANGFPGGPGGPGCPSRIPNSVGNATGAEGCCCLTFKASCTMNLERAFHVKLFYNRKKGIAPEEFNDYWANKHSALATNFHLRMGAIRYSQYHSTPELRDLVRVDGGLPILEFDGAAEFWVPNLETFAAMGSDPEYVNVIQPDEANFIDAESMRLIVGVDYIVVENQNAVMEHGRTFPRTNYNG